MTLFTNENVSKYKNTVESWMNESCYCLKYDDTLYDAASIMIENEITQIAVIDDNRCIIGIISYSRLLKALLNGHTSDQLVENWISTNFTYLYNDEYIHELPSPLGNDIPVLDRNKRVIGTFPAARKITELHQQLQSLEEIVNMYEICFDTAYEGITVVDEKGYIRLINHSYSRFVRMRKEDAVGKHCTEVIDNTRLPVVLETGIPERLNAVILQGQEMVAHVIPIWKKGKIIGAIGMLVFEGASEIFQAFDKLQMLKETNNEQIVFEIPQKDEEKITFDKIIGESKSIGEVKKIARRAAKTMATVLINGESGAGKELFANAIHQLSPVKGGPFISINCAAIPDELLESELFGYAHGAFTGAKKGGKPGKFELAHNGTLFLDEIGDMSLHLQTKLLRVLQEQKFSRIGGIGEIKVNVRIVAATNQPLEKLVKEGSFRKDLYYRIHIVSLSIPPLKERKSDIPLLVSHLLENIYKKHQLGPIKLCREVMERFIVYDWPGNVREMANILERIVVTSEQQQISVQDLPLCFSDHDDVYIENRNEHITQNERENNPVSFALSNHKTVSEEQERAIIENVLQKVDGNKSKAAKILGIHRTTLYKKMAKYHF